MARYQGHRIDEWLDAKLEGWLGLSINREKTKVVNLHLAESLDFLGFTFRYDRDLYGSGDLNTYLRGWSNYFEFGYPRKAFRDLGHYTRKRMVTHLNRRSQRKYHRWILPRKASILSARPSSNRPCGCFREPF